MPRYASTKLFRRFTLLHYPRLATKCACSFSLALFSVRQVDCYGGRSFGDGLSSLFSYYDVQFDRKKPKCESNGIEAAAKEFQRQAGIPEENWREAAELRTYLARFR